MSLRAITLIIVFLASLPVCFVRPFYGVLVWAVIAFLNPQSFTWGAAAALPWALAAAIPTLAGTLLFERDYRNLMSGKTMLIVVLWAWFTFTTVASTSTPVFIHHAADTWMRYSMVSKILLMSLVTVALLSSYERLRIYVMVMAGCFGFFVAKSFPFLIITHGAFRLYGPEHSMVADNNDLGLALDMTLPLFFYLAQTEESRWVRWTCGFLFVITLPAVFFTYSRGAVLGLTVVIGLMLLRSRRRWVLIPVLALGMLTALMFAPDAWKERMNPTREDAVDASARARFNAWGYSWNLASDYPLAGGGFATFTPELFSIYAPHALDIHGPHSIYFQVLAEHGFIGLALYLMLVAACLVTVARLLHEGRRRHDKFVLCYAQMFRFSLVGFLTAGAFLGRAYFDYFLSIVGCIIALDRLAHQAWAKADQEAAEAAEEEEALVN